MINISSGLKNELIEITKLQKKVLLIVGSKSFKVLNSNLLLKKILANGGEYKILKKKRDLISNIEIAEHLLEIEFFIPEIIIAMGGGSVIDLAKLIIYHNYLNHKNNLKFIVIPTTCGSGSESTSFAVVYENGIKNSIQSNLISPDKIVHDPSLLKFLPKKALWSSISDSFCQSIESLWSKNSNKISKGHALKSLKLIVKAIENTEKPNLKKLLIASFHSGCAINISKTTGPHSFSYFLSYKYSIPHGLAVLFTMKEFLKINLKEKDIRSTFFKNLEGIFKCSEEIYTILDLILKKSNFKFKLNKDSFKNSQGHINHQRLSNNPVKVNQKDYINIYINSLSNHDK